MQISNTTYYNIAENHSDNESDFLSKTIILKAHDESNISEILKKVLYKFNESPLQEKFLDKLESIDIFNSVIKEQDIEILNNILKHTTNLKSLSIQRSRFKPSNINDDEVIRLFKNLMKYLFDNLMNLEKLKELIICRNYNIDLSEETESLFSLIENHPSIERVDLGSTRLTSQDINSILEILIKDKKIKYIGIQKNFNRDHGKEQLELIKNLFRKNRSLCSINLSNLNLSDAESEELLECLVDNYSLLGTSLRCTFKESSKYKNMQNIGFILWNNRKNVLPIAKRLASLILDNEKIEESPNNEKIGEFWVEVQISNM